MNLLALVQSPREFFRSVKKEDFNTTLKKIGIWYVMAVIANAILYHYSIMTRAYAFFAELFAGLPGQTPPAPSGIGADIFSSVLGSVIGLAVGSALLLVALKLLKVKARFQDILKIYLYTTTLVSLIMIVILVLALFIPGYAGLWFAFLISLPIGIWGFFLKFIGLSEQLSITKSRAFAAIALVVGFFFAISIIIIILSIVINVAAFFSTEGFTL